MIDICSKVTVKRHVKYPLWFIFNLKQLIKKKKKIAHCSHTNSVLVNYCNDVSRQRFPRNQISKTYYLRHLQKVQNNFEIRGFDFWKFVEVK